MSSFSRNRSTVWREQVPGARWYRADLHVHTLDDHLLSKFRFPSGLSGDATDVVIQEKYARIFLRHAIANGIEVLGLTPHSVRSGSTDETSSTWRIIETWNNDDDDDGIPFRDKIYAIFPGFESNLADGDEGLHLLFMFDPEIGRENYLSAFNNVMGAVHPWDGGSLRISTKDSSATFDAILELHNRLKSDWDYLVLAPHAFGNRGLFSLKSQILKWYPHEHICAVELKDDWLPQDAYADKPWLEEGMKKSRHSFFQSSDAYTASDIGRRFTLVKLASPRIEALRQAFLAADSRLRTTCQRNNEGQIFVRTDLPEPCPGGRPWLKSVTIEGGTSFFAGTDVDAGITKQQTFLLNPDLNCLIGGRMSGKSTFLDGLRIWFDHDLPKDPEIKKDVQDRADKRFLSGDAEISVVLHSSNAPTAPNRERWPALFYAQRELQKAVRDQETRRQILYRLIPLEAPGFIQRDQQLSQLDQQLNTFVSTVESCREKLEAAEEDSLRVRKAKEALQRFNAAGIDNLIKTQADSGRLKVIEDTIEKIVENVLDLELETPGLSTTNIINDAIKVALNGESGDTSYDDIVAKYQDSLSTINDYIKTMQHRVVKAQEVTTLKIAQELAAVQQALIEAGGTAEELNQFDALTELAGEYERARDQYTHAKQEYSNAYRQFATAHMMRAKVLAVQRDAMKRVAETIKDKFPDRIRIRIDDDGVFDSIERWIHDLRESGVTRWWNNQSSSTKSPINPDHIRRALNRRQLTSIGMTDRSALTFLGLMTSRRRIELAAIRSADK